MPNYVLSMTCHVKTKRAIDGEAGLEISRFFGDLAAAVRLQTLDMPKELSPSERKARIETHMDEVVQGMPSALRRGFQLHTTAKGGEVEDSQWDRLTKTWIPDDDGFSLVFPLILDPGVPTDALEFEVGGEMHQASFQVAVTAREE